MRKGKRLREHFRKGYNPRRQQGEFLDFVEPYLYSDDAFAIVAEMPVGTGKSLCADAVARACEADDKTCAIVTGSNLLLNQYHKEFPELACLMGAGNYQCICFPGQTCEQTRAQKKVLKAVGIEMPKCEGCPYEIARFRALQEYICIFNTMSYLYFPKFYKQEDERGITRKIPIVDVLIVDEFQMVPSMLSSIFELKIWETDIKFPIGISASLVSVTELLQARVEAIKNLIAGNLNQLKQREVQALLYQMDKISMIITGFKKSPTEFVIEEIEAIHYKEMKRCLHIRSIRPLKFILKNFFYAKQIILMSATAVETDIQDLGFKDYVKFECDSPIPVENRLITVSNIAKNTTKNQEVAVPAIAKEIRRLVFEEFPDYRGVVLTTYAQAELLKPYLPEPLFLFHGSQDKKDVIDFFISQIDQRYVAILSGSFEGLDLKGDLARFVIMCKVPLPNIGDLVVQRRMEIDKALPEPLNWYELQAMKLIVQGSGRGSRNEVDFSHIRIIDSMFAGVYAKTKKHLPKTFKEAIRWS